MPHPDDQSVVLPTDLVIIQKSNPESKSLRAVVITSNDKKMAEFNAQLGDGYGVSLKQRQPQLDERIEDEQQRVAMCLAIMGAETYSPHFILCEQTTLESVCGRNLTHLPLEELAKEPLLSVIHTSTLYVFKPQWAPANATNSTVITEKQLTGFTLRQYQKRSYGYIASSSNISCTEGFGWDALFVNAATNLSNEQFYALYGKKTARQHTISDFIETYLRYKALATMKHHHLDIKNPIDFGSRFVRLTEFVANEPHMSNPWFADWGIHALRTAMLNEGIFFRAAWTRPVRNFFSPPLSGLPLTAKKDVVEETIFMTHDILHHLVCDLICDTEPSKANFNVYAAWRMISEATTMVLADMFYADSLIKSGAMSSGVDARIYPLFAAIKTVQNFSDPASMSKDNKIKLIKTLLLANVRYALLGDDSGWRALLTSADGTLSEDNLGLLTAYKNHFEKFFIGDIAWTAANFANMYKHSKPLAEWVKSVGRETFRGAKIPLLSDVADSLAAKNDVQHYPTAVTAVFELIFASKIEPHLVNDQTHYEDDVLIQSRAFRRFLIGQVSLFARYPTPLNLEFIKEEILARLKNDAPFSNEEQDKIRMQIHQYILGIEGLRMMSREEAMNAIDCSTVFPPVYISYPQMKKKYGTIRDCMHECVEGYQPPQSSDSHWGLTNQDIAGESNVNHYVRVIDGTTYIDAIALEETIDLSVLAKDRLREKMMRVGVEFWNEDQTVIKKPIVGISSIGGFSVCLTEQVPAGMISLRLGDQISEPLAPALIAAGFRQTMGMQSSHTYMNPKKRSAQQLYETTLSYQHLSMAHAVSIGFHIFGISKKAELEFDVQRDLIHLARETSARTEAQDNPTLVALTYEGAIIAEQIRLSIDSSLKSFKQEGKKLDYLEERNALFPLSSAVSLGINATLRNFGKVIADLGGQGKELEYRTILALINDSLNTLFPELFKQTAEYGHSYPVSWEQRKKLSVPSSSVCGFFAPEHVIYPAKNTAKRAILLLGAPGVGKSTQTERITKHCPKVMCISTGNLVRTLQNKIEDNKVPLNPQEQAAAASLELMKRGQLMEDKAVYDLLMAYLSPGGEGHQQYINSDTIILDGVIKAERNIIPFEHALETFNNNPNNVPMSFAMVINIAASEVELIARQKSRVNKAIQTGQEQRPDDESSVYVGRLSLYMSTIAAVIDYYKTNYKFIDIDSSNGIEETTQRLVELIAIPDEATLAEPERYIRNGR